MLNKFQFFYRGSSVAKWSINAKEVQKLYYTYTIVLCHEWMESFH